MKPRVYETAKISPTTLLKMADNTFIGDFCLINCKRLTMLQGSQINSGTRIVGGRGNVYLGKNVVVSYSCTLLTATDTPEGKFMCDAMPEFKRKILVGDIKINENAFIGAHCVIMPRVTIGRRAVIGAGCYIDIDIPAETLVIPEQVLIFKKRSNRVEHT